MSIPEVKQNLINEQWNIIAYWEVPERTKTWTNKCGPKTNLGSWDGGGSATPGKPCSFYSYLSLETVFSALKLTQNYFIINIGCPVHHVYPVGKIIFTMWQNMKVRELQKSQSTNLLVNWEKCGCTL